MANNKIIYNGQVLIDLTGDTITAADLAKNVTAHDKSGAVITGTNTKDSDTSDATVAVAEMLSGKTAYARGAKLEGTMPNRGKVTGTISTKDGSYTIQQGYHDGSGSVSIASTAVAQLLPENIREGITVLGITGTMSGSEDESPQETITVTPTASQQIITPDEGYTCLRQVVVNAIPYVESDNAAGGKTITIG